MRKMKKINGYLVVKFNARELREYEGTALGEYGVIDAELYTGILDVDRGAMEYDNAGSMEEAVELARGLESELDAEEPEVKVTIVKETDETTEEEEVDAQQMIAGWENVLRGQVASAHYKDVDERTAAHELYGYKVALRDLGLLDREDCYVLPDTFGDAPGPLPKKPEELLSYVCDELCRHRRPEMTQEELDAVCEKCSLERLANEADGRDLRAREKALGALYGLIGRIQNVKESIGNSLLPTINDLMSTGEQVLTKVGSWVEENQELVRVIMLVVLAIGGFLTIAGTVIAVVSGVGLIITKVISGFKLLKAGFLLAKGALTPLISSVWSFTAALLANPVTWIVIGIVALIAALVLLYNKCEWFRNAVNAIIDFFKEKLGAALEVASAIFSGIGNVIGSVMNAAKATVSQNLDNMRSAYEAHGGGIRGAAAAAVEGVKGIYTAGFSFLDNLTGGRLSAIRDKFVGFVTNIASGVSERFTAVKTAFFNGITAIKNTVTGAVTWFFESGKRVVTTFANGIKSAFTGAVDAVKGGLQRIRNMLPFSDAKEGPLSTLTLSGQRTMTTYAHGLELAQDAPAQAIEKGLDGAKATLERKPVQKVDLTSGGGKKEGSESGGSGEGSSGKQVIIQKLLIPVDLKKIKDLEQLLAMLKEVEDYAEANGSEEPADDQDAEPAPA